MRRTLTAFGAAGLLAAGAIGAAPMAAAVDYTTGACDATQPLDAAYNVATYILNPGDTLTVTADGFVANVIEPGCIMVPEAADGDISIDGGVDPARVVFTAHGTTGVGLILAARWDGVYTQPYYYTFAITCDEELLQEVRDLGLQTIGSCTDTQAPPTPDIMQQTTPLPDGSCDITDPAYNWGGVASGGWSGSWAEWPNANTGGAVCTRTLTYGDSTGRWAVAG